MASSYDRLFKIAHVNVRSLAAHFDSFRELILMNNYDVMCVTETWLGENSPLDCLRVEGYNFFYQN